LKVPRVELRHVNRQQLFAILMVGMMVLSGVAYAVSIV